jgi:hypothetical protein
VLGDRARKDWIFGTLAREVRQGFALADGADGRAACRAHFDWPLRPRGAPGRALGFRGYEVEACRPAGEEGSEWGLWRVQVRSKWDVGCTHVVEHVDELVVAAGFVVAAEWLRAEGVLRLRGPADGPRPQAVLAQRPAGRLELVYSLAEAGGPAQHLCLDGPAFAERFIRALGAQAFDEAWAMLSEKFSQRFAGREGFAAQLGWVGVITRHGEGGRRGPALTGLSVFEAELRGRDMMEATVRTEWGAGTVYEDALTLRRVSGGRLEVAAHLSLGLAPKGVVLDATQDRSPSFVVYAPRVPGDEQGVHTQGSAAVEVRLAEGATGPPPEPVGGTRGFAAVRVPVGQLAAVEVGHTVALFESRLCLRDAVPAGFASLAGAHPALSPEETRRWLAHPLPAHAAALRAVLEACNGMCAAGEAEVVYAVRLQQALAEVAADAEARVSLDGRERPQRAAAFAARQPADDGEWAARAAVAPSPLDYAVTYACGLRLNGLPARLLLGAAAELASGEAAAALRAELEALPMASADAACPLTLPERVEQLGLPPEQLDAAEDEAR